MLRYKTVPFELKALKDRQFEGYGSTFGNTDLGGDIVMPGAFTGSLRAKKPKMLKQHNPDAVPGVWEHMEEDQNGLYVRGRLINTTLGNDTYIEMKEGALDGMSIGYITLKDDGKRNPRKLLAVDLWEVSIVTFPMNEEALINQVKNLWGRMPTTRRELEASLREQGLSLAEAKTTVSQLAKVFNASVDVGPDGMSDGQLRDAAIDSETAELLKMIEQSSASMLTEAFK